MCSLQGYQGRGGARVPEAAFQGPDGRGRGLPRGSGALRVMQGRRGEAVQGRQAWGGARAGVPGEGYVAEVAQMQAGCLLLGKLTILSSLLNKSSHYSVPVSFFL